MFDLDVVVGGVKNKQTNKTKDGRQPAARTWNQQQQQQQQHRQPHPTSDSARRDSVRNDSLPATQQPMEKKDEKKRIVFHLETKKFDIPHRWLALYISACVLLFLAESEFEEEEEVCVCYRIFLRKKIDSS